MLEVSSNISAYRVITMSDRKALELSLNGISPFKRGEGSNWKRIPRTASDESNLNSDKTKRSFLAQDSA